MFQVSGLEKAMLLEVVRHYPRVPSAHHRLTRSGNAGDGQELLEESLAEHRRSHRRQVDAMLRSRTRFRANAHGWRFTLKAGQAEWLLQVLNDVRVGSWLALGAPDGPRAILKAVNARTAPQFRLMEAAGMFEMVLLEAMELG